MCVCVVRVKRRGEREKREREREREREVMMIQLLRERATARCCVLGGEGASRSKVFMFSRYASKRGREGEREKERPCE